MQTAAKQTPTPDELHSELRAIRSAGGKNFNPLTVNKNMILQGTTSHTFVIFFFFMDFLLTELDFKMLSFICEG